MSLGTSVARAVTYNDFQTKVVLAGSNITAATPSPTSQESRETLSFLLLFTVSSAIPSRFFLFLYIFFPDPILFAISILPFLSLIPASPIDPHNTTTTTTTLTTSHFLFSSVPRTVQYLLATSLCFVLNVYSSIVSLMERRKYNKSVHETTTSYACPRIPLHANLNEKREKRKREK